MRKDLKGRLDRSPGQRNSEGKCYLFTQRGRGCRRGFAQLIAVLFSFSSTFYAAENKKKREKGEKAVMLCEGGNDLCDKIFFFCYIKLKHFLCVFSTSDSLLLCWRRTALTMNDFN